MSSFPITLNVNKQYSGYSKTCRALLPLSLRTSYQDFRVFVTKLIAPFQISSTLQVKLRILDITTTQYSEVEVGLSCDASNVQSFQQLISNKVGGQNWEAFCELMKIKRKNYYAAKKADEKSVSLPSVLTSPSSPSPPGLFVNIPSPTAAPRSSSSSSEASTEPNIDSVDIIQMDVTSTTSGEFLEETVARHEKEIQKLKLGELKHKREALVHKKKILLGEISFHLDKLVQDYVGLLPYHNEEKINTLIQLLDHQWSPSQSEIAQKTEFLRSRLSDIPGWKEAYQVQKKVRTVISHGSDIDKSLYNVEKLNKLVDDIMVDSNDAVKAGKKALIDTGMDTFFKTTHSSTKRQQKEALAHLETTALNSLKSASKKLIQLMKTITASKNSDPILLAQVPDSDETKEKEKDAGTNAEEEHDDGEQGDDGEGNDEEEEVLEDSHDETKETRDDEEEDD
ncbi:MAG: hypothetical protein Sylvanvirus22_8 [Sylvanvirus sp.]|uniref:Uncharacterized protein n=1 Tax=Sylvanvirus sp. TaxID=2487774 RepID=A0A3G5AM26_9VIRU|nr:MAG: hypothetical protein Sylvanvirus22_8 [Sylvanvirus sp.]